MGRDCSALPRSGWGFLHLPGWWKELQPGMSLGLCFPPAWGFSVDSGFLPTPPPPLLKLPFENIFCFFPPAPAKLLSTKGVTKWSLRKRKDFFLFFYFFQGRAK